jgi:2-C-methyl-D-erythritol 4-phosphate cytidylyltransferase / 2-C-methyl-D-erythritol 2,4-cyclodiphosphate synthase
MADHAVGLGFDVHPFTAGGELWLGGLLFEGEDGLSGHSDGDVVCHAVADALLGAVAMGDIGEHFPESSSETAGIGGDELMSRTLRILSKLGRAPVSMDVTVVCDRPQIAPRRGEMRERLAAISGIPVDRVSVKATRPEGLGLFGDGIGCLALAVVG